MDVPALEKAIRAILTAPNVDLSTISSKRVRKDLAEQFGASLVKENKEAIDALIIEAFNDIATAAGATEPENDTSAPDNVTAGTSALPPPKPKQEEETTNGYYTSKSSAKKHDYQEEGSEVSEPEQKDDDGSAFSDEESEDAKPSASKGKLKASPQKREVMQDNMPPESSPSVPLSLATGLTDEEYARQLQEQFNAADHGGRATRGGGYQQKASKSRKGKSVSTSSGKGAKGKKVKSKEYISDSDLEDDEDDDDDDAPAKAKRKRKAKREDSDDDEAEAKPKKKKSSGGGGGGYNAELSLSEPLQQVCGAPTMSRPKIVKALWEYIREKGLQDPAKKSDIINDALFQEIFGVEKMTMFSMNKHLKKSVKPLGS